MSSDLMAVAYASRKGGVGDCGCGCSGASGGCGGAATPVQGCGGVMLPGDPNGAVSDGSEPMIPQATYAAVQRQLSQFPFLVGPSYCCPQVAGGPLGAPMLPIQNSVPWFLRPVRVSRAVPRGLRGVGATQAFTLAAGTMTINATVGDSLVFALPAGAAWAAQDPVLIETTLGGNTTGGTPGGNDNVVLSNVSGSTSNSQLNWVDSSGTAQTTVLAISTSAAPAPPAPNPTPVPVVPPPVAPTPVPPAPAATSTGLSTGAVLGITAGAILAGGLLAYVLHKPHGAAPAHAQMVHHARPYRSLPRNRRVARNRRLR